MGTRDRWTRGPCLCRALALCLTLWLPGAVAAEARDTGSTGTRKVSGTRKTTPSTNAPQPVAPPSRTAAPASAGAAPAPSTIATPAPSPAQGGPAAATGGPSIDLTAAVDAPGAPTASSFRPPARRFGVGMLARSDGSLGAYGSYAVTDRLHAGLELALDLQRSDLGSMAVLTFSPHVRYLFPLSARVHPFLSGGAALELARDGQLYQLELGVGTEYFATDRLGVIGQVQVLTASLGYTRRIAGGITAPSLAVEWYF